MNLKQVGSNMTELRANGGLTILYSYETPVACGWTNGNGGWSFYRTSKRWSPTTSRHIRKWLALKGTTLVVEKSQDYFDNLMKEVA